MREHGDGAVREVDRVAAQPRFKVEIGRGSNVLGYIRDMDLQLPLAVRLFADEHGVVEVTRGLAVNGDDRQAAEVVPLVDAPRHLFFVKPRNIARLLEYGIREDARQVMLADDNLDVHTEVIGVAQYLDHAAAGDPGGRGKIGNLDVYRQAFKILVAGNLTRSCSPLPKHPVGRASRRWQRCVEGDQQRLGHLVVKGDDLVTLLWLILCIAEDTDHCGISAGKHAGDPSGAFAIAAGRRQLDQYLVALHRAPELTRGDEDVAGFAALPRHAHEAETVPVQVQAPGYQVVAHLRRPGNSPLLAIDLGQPARRGEPRQVLHQ